MEGTLGTSFDFLTNYLYFSFGILERPLALTSKSFLWLFVEPLEPAVWVLVIFFIFITALALATLNFFSPNRNDYGFLESIFTAFGAMYQGMTMSAPSRWSSRILQVTWWLFALLFTVIYTANYAAMRMSAGITSDSTGFSVRFMHPFTGHSLGLSWSIQK